MSRQMSTTAASYARSDPTALPGACRSKPHRAERVAADERGTRTLDEEGVVRTVDAVVIGAGHNGLVAANLLADAGWEVLVKEATGDPGGSVRTAELTAPGFRNDVCSAFYPLGAASPVSTGWALEAYGLEWSHAPDVLAHVLPDNRCAVLSQDVARTAESMAAFAPADAAAWREETDQWQRIGGPLVDSPLYPSRQCAPGRGCCGASARRRRCGWPSSGSCRYGSTRRGASPARARGCCWPAAPCTPTGDRSSRQRGVRVAAHDARPERRVPGPARRRRSADRGPAAPASSPGRDGGVPPAGAAGTARAG
jgi:hypothetical protein